MLLKHFFSRRWLAASLLVIAALGVLVRLGIWQIDRLHQRREFNARVLAQIEAPALQLTGEAFEEDLAGMEYRSVVVEGVYEPAYQVALINQAYQNQYGAHLLTPLRIRGSDQTIVIDRGWIPAEEALSGAWEQFDEPGLVKVSGVIRLPQSKPDYGRLADPTPIPGQAPLKVWNLANLSQMARQMPGPLLDVYIQQSPDPSWLQLPYRTEPDLDLTEGSHMSYALQWFTFAAILAVGYPLYVKRENQRTSKKISETVPNIHSDRKVST